MKNIKIILTAMAIISDGTQLGVKGADKELGSASRKLEEYKRKLIAK